MGRLPLNFEGPPLGPPGRSSLPLVTGLAATGFGLGVGFDTEVAGSPCPVWMVLLLYVSSRATVESLTALTVASFPGFLLYSILRLCQQVQPLGNFSINSRFTDFQVQLAPKDGRQVGEKLGLENTTEERVRFLRANDNREPVILQVRCADVFDSAHWNRAFRGNRQLVVHDRLDNHVHVSGGLATVNIVFNTPNRSQTYQDKNAWHRFT